MNIVPASSTNWSDLAALFETSKECADCWCMNHRSSPKQCPTGPKAKEGLSQVIQEGTANGLLAFVDSKAVGWCAVDPVGTQVGHDYYLQLAEKPSSSVWMIHCLYVDPKHRGIGISQALIAEAVSFARKKEATQILAFPIPQDSIGRYPVDAEFAGRLSSYLKLGFQEEQRLNNFYQVVSLDIL